MSQILHTTCSFFFLPWINQLSTCNCSRGVTLLTSQHSTKSFPISLQHEFDDEKYQHLQGVTLSDFMLVWIGSIFYFSRLSVRYQYYLKQMWVLQKLECLIFLSIDTDLNATLPCQVHASDSWASLVSYALTFVLGSNQSTNSSSPKKKKTRKINVEVLLSHS